MKLKSLLTLVSAFLVSVSALLPVAPADATSLCYRTSPTGQKCIYDDVKDDSHYFGEDGDILRCPLYYFGIKINEGHDYLPQIDLVGIGSDGIVEPGSTITAKVRLELECYTIADAYRVNLRLESSTNPELVAVQSSSKFTRREQFSSRIDSYCFTETCGFSLLEFTFNIPKDYKRDVVSLKAKVEPNLSYQPRAVSKEFSHSQAFTVERRLKFLSDAGVSQELMEIDGRILCWTSDPTPSGVSEFRIQKLEFQMVTYVRGGEKVIDRGSWALGNPPNDFVSEAMNNGNSSSLLLDGQVKHVFSFSEQTQGEAYGCQIRAVTDIGNTAWNASKVVATRTVRDGVVQMLPNVKVLCAKLTKTYPGGVALSSKSKNIGPKAKYKPKVSAAVYQRNKKLDIDGDGIACER